MWSVSSSEIHPNNIIFVLLSTLNDQVNCLEPHPHLPGMATSGLDHDIKLWAPTAESPTGLKGLKEVLCSCLLNICAAFLITFTPLIKDALCLPKVMKKNKRERDEDSVRHGDQYDTQLLWFLMRHMRNRRPPRVSSETVQPMPEMLIMF